MTLAEARPQEDPPTVTADETTAPVEAEEYEEYDDEPEVTDTRMGRGFGVIAVAALIVALASAVTAGATVFYILESTTRSEERTAQLVAALKEKVGIKRTIKEYGVAEADFMRTLDDMVENAFNDQCTGANPRYPLMSEIKELYLKAFHGV